MQLTSSSSGVLARLDFLLLLPDSRVGSSGAVVLAALTAALALAVAMSAAAWSC